MIKPILPPDFHNEVNTLLSNINENTIGVYFLTHKDTVVYVGQSIDILNRIQQHRRSDDKIFDSFYYDECSIDELDLIEKDFIESYKPPFNIRDNKDYFIGIEKYCDDSHNIKLIDLEDSEEYKEFKIIIDKKAKVNFYSDKLSQIYIKDIKIYSNLRQGSYEISNYKNQKNISNYQIDIYQNQKTTSKNEIDEYKNYQNYSFYQLGKIEIPPKRVIIKGFEWKF